MIIRTITLVTALGTLLIGCTSKASKEAELDSNPSGFCLNDELKKNTSISDVNEEPIQDQLTLTGKVEYNENDLVAFKSLIDGIVTKVYFELGDHVTKGKVLAVVKSTEIQEINEEKGAQLNQIELLNKQLKTKKELLNDGLVSQPEVLEIEYELKQAKIELNKISSKLQMYHSVGGGQFQIVAPKDGYIVQKDISVGQVITTDNDNPLFSISNLNQVWVMINVYANNLKYIRVGDPVKVKTVAYPDRIYNGRIDKIYNVFDENEHVTKARVVLENQDLNLMPGLSADIIINKKNSIGNAYAIPHKAVVFSNNKNYVVVYKDDCNLEVRRVTPITRNEEYVYVNEKFSSEEKIITTNALILLEELKK